MIGVSPLAVADLVIDRCADESRELAVLWCATAQSRTEFAREVEAAIGHHPAVALVVAGIRFNDPNAVLDDFASLLDQSRIPILDRLESIASSRLRVVLLVSRTPLAVPQLSSPALLPDWLPEFGGTTIAVHMEDVTWSARVPLSDDALDSAALSAAVYEFDYAAVNRFAAVASSSPGSVESLFDRIRHERDASVFSFCSGAIQELGDVQNPEGYRPSVRYGATLVTRLWSAAQAESPDRRGRIAKSLVPALALADTVQFPPESFVSVLARPATPIGFAAQRYMLGVLNAVVAACQLTTAAAHADAYPSFPQPLLHSFSVDLQHALRSAATLLSD